MSLRNIRLFSEDLVFNLKNKKRLRTWLRNAVITEGYKLKEINFIFCSDAYLLSINQEYLKHDTLTDIITFDNSEEEKKIVGDIFISLERVRENALYFKVSEENEIHRVMIHGTLHLLGYSDKGKDAKLLMTARENYHLEKLDF